MNLIVRAVGTSPAALAAVVPVAGWIACWGGGACGCLTGTVSFVFFRKKFPKFLSIRSDSWSSGDKRLKPAIASEIIAFLVPAEFVP